MHDVIVLGGEDRRDDQRITAAQEAAEHVGRTLGPGTSVELTIRKKGSYQMATLSDELTEWFDTASVHVVVSVAFLSHFPRYNLTPVAKDAFWVVVGKLAETNPRGQYIHMQGPGEVPITQDVIAQGCGAKGVSRQTASGGMQQLMERSFLWKAGRGKYQIHPHLLYFGSAEKQSEAIGYATARRKDGKLPPIPVPGTEIVIMSVGARGGVRRVIA